MLTEQQADKGRSLRAGFGIVTEEELANSLELKVETLASWRMKSSGPSFTKLGKTVFYRVQDIQLWIDANVISITTTTVPDAV